MDAPTAWIVLVVVVLVIAGMVLAARRRGAVGAGETVWRLEPAGAGGHTHTAVLDDSGSGVSTPELGHWHTVEAIVDRGYSMAPDANGVSADDAGADAVGVGEHQHALTRVGGGEESKNISDYIVRVPESESGR
jgi:hypothetical protein